MTRHYAVTTCPSARMTGTLKLLTTGGSLHFYRITSRAGLLNSGDRAALSATFTLSPAQTITSP